MKENAFTTRVFPRPPLLGEPPKKGFIWILEVLIALLVYYAASIPISVMTSPFIAVYTIKNFDPRAVMPDIEKFDLNGIAEYVKNLYEAVKTLLENIPAWITLITLFSFAFITLAVIIYRVKIRKGTLYSLGVKKAGAVKNYAAGLLIGFILFSAAVGMGLLTKGLEFTGFAGFSISNTVYLFLFLLGYFVQGMAEEMLCRGLLMTSISRRHSVLCAVIVNSVFFALLHIVNPGISLLAFINLFLFGVFASLVMIKTDNIWMVSAIHTVWNFTQGNVFGIKVSGSAYVPSVMKVVSSGSKFINGGDFGLEGGICVTIVLLIGIVIFALIKPKEKELSAFDFSSNLSKTSSDNTK